MALCVYCREETELHDGGTAVCVACADARSPHHAIAARLRQDLATAAERAATANTAFHALMRKIPSSLPKPDGSHRLQSASRELSIARQAMMEATLRLNDFLNRGTIPDDLER